MLACGIVFLGVATALVLHFVTGIPMPTMVGILSGAVTNTPIRCGSAGLFRYVRGF